MTNATDLDERGDQMLFWCLHPENLIDFTILRLYLKMTLIHLGNPIEKLSDGGSVIEIYEMEE